MLTSTFIIPIDQIVHAVAWCETRSSTECSTIDVQSRAIAIECETSALMDRVAPQVDERPGWRRRENLWLFFEVLEPTVDFQAELDSTCKIVAALGLAEACEVAECRVVVVEFPSKAVKADFCEAAKIGLFGDPSR